MSVEGAITSEQRGGKIMRQRQLRHRSGGRRSRIGADGARQGKKWAPAVARRRLRPRRTAALLLRLQIPEGDRVSKRVHFGDAVLPFRPRWSAQQVGGPRLGRDGDTFPRAARPSAKPEAAG